MIPRFSRSRCRVRDGTFLPERHFPRTPPLNGRADRSARGSAWAGRRSGGCSPVPWPDPRPSSGAPGWPGRGSWRRRRRRASGRPLGRRPSWLWEVTDAGTSRRAWRVGAAAEAAAGPQCSSHPGGPAAASPGTVSETPPTSQDPYARRGPSGSRWRRTFARAQRSPRGEDRRRGEER